MRAATSLSLARRVLAASCLLAGALAAQAADRADRDEARLRAIRKAMVDAALNTTTQVRATSWMDSGGVLHEFNRFSSEIRLRDLRLGAAPVQDARVPVKDSLAQDEALVSADVTPVAPQACPAPAAKSALRHVMTAEAVLSPTLSPAQRYPAQQVGRQAVAALQAQAVSASQWRTVQVAQPGGTYEQRMFSVGQEHLQWQVLLVVEALASGVGAEDMPALVLRWQVRPRGQTQPWFEWRDDIPPAREAANLATPRVDVPMQAAIVRSAQRLSAELDRRLACEPQPLRLHSDDGQLVLSAGDLSGLRVGDRVLLADGRTLPQHALEAGALDAAVLAEVKSVSAYRAELRQVAGPRQKFNPSWVAWPYTY